MGRRILAFLLGTIFGMVLLVGAVAGAIYVGVAVVTPNQVVPGSDKYLGDFANLTVKDMVIKVKDTYLAKINQPDANGNYYTIGQFMTDNKIDIQNAFGVTLPQEVLDVPMFEFFAEGGIDRALSQIKVSTVPAILNMFVTDSGILDQTAVEELANYSMADLLNEEKGIGYVFQNIKLSQIIAGVFPAEESENKLMYALGEACLGKLITSFSGESNMLLQLKEGGALEVLGSLQITELIGDNSAYLTAILRDATIDDLIDETGAINPDDLINNLYLGDLLSYKRGEVDPATLIEPQYLLSDLSTQDKKLYKDTTAEGMFVLQCQDKYYLAQLACKQDHTHTLDCYGHRWYSVTALEPGHQHSDDELVENGSHYPLATGLFKIFADITVGQIASDTNSVIEMVKDVKVGDLVGKVEGVLASFAEYTIRELMEGAFDGIYLGSLLGFQRSEFAEELLVAPAYTLSSLSTADKKLYADTTDDTIFVLQDGNKYYKAQLICKIEEHAHTADCPADCNKAHSHDITCYGHCWYQANETLDYKPTDLVKGDGKHYALVGGLYGVLTNVTIGELTSGDSSLLIDKLMDIKLKELLEGQQMEGIMETLAEFTIRELMEGGFEDLSLGGLLGFQRKEFAKELLVAPTYTLSALSTTDKALYVDTTDNTVFVLQDGEKYYQGQLACKIEEHTHDATCDGTCDKEHSHTVDCYGYCWYQSTETTNPAEYAPTDLVKGDGKHYALLSGLYGVLSDITIGQLTSGDTSILMDKLMDIPLEELLEGQTISGIMENLAHMTIRELMDGGIDGLYIGSLLSFERLPVEDMTNYGSVSPIKNNKNETIYYVATDSYGNMAISVNNKEFYQGQIRCTDDGCAHTLADCYGFVWYQKDELGTITIKGEQYAPADGIENKLADFTVSGLSNVSDEIKNFTLAEVFGEDGIPDMLKSLGDTKIGDLSTALEDLYLGEILSYSRKEVTDFSGYGQTETLYNEAEIAYYLRANGSLIVLSVDNKTWYEGAFTCDDDTHEHTWECYDFVWYTDNTLVTRAEGVTGKLAVEKVSDLSNLNEKIKEFTLIDVLGEDGVPDMLKSLGNTKVGDLATAIDGVYLGEVLGYYRKPIDNFEGYGLTQTLLNGTEVGYHLRTKGSLIALSTDDKNWYEGTLTCEDDTHEHTWECYDFVWYTDQPCTTLAEGVTGKLAVEKLGDLGTLNEKIKEFTLIDVLGEDGVPDMLKSLGNEKIGNLGDAINGMYVGEMLSYKRLPVQEVSGYIPVVGIGGNLPNVLTNGTQIVKLEKDVYYFAHLICEDDTHTTLHTADCYSHVWYMQDASGSVTIEGEKYSQASGMMGKIAKEKISDLKNLDSKIKNFTLHDVMGDDVPEMLASLSDTKIGNLGTAIDGLFVGEMLKYKRLPVDTTAYVIVGTNNGVMQNGDKYAKLDGETWYDAKLDCDLSHAHTADCYCSVWYEKDATGPVTINGEKYKKAEGVAAMLANKRINELSGDTITDIVNNATLGEVIQMDGSTNKMLLEMSDVKISQLGSEINNLYVGSAMGYNREELTDASGLTSTGVADLYTDGINYYVLQNGKYYLARCACDKVAPHVHDQTCPYEVAWFKNDVMIENGIELAFVNSTINGLSEDMNDITLRKLGIGKGNNILEAMQDTPLNNITAEINGMYLGVVLGYDKAVYTPAVSDEFSTYVGNVYTLNGNYYIWDVTYNVYYNATLKCHDTHSHGQNCFGYVWQDDLGAEVKGLNARMSNMTVAELGEGSGLTDIVTTLTIGDLIESEMMTLSEEDQYKLDVIFDTSGTCNLFGYIMSGQTAKNYYISNHGTDEQYRGTWKALTLENFISTLLSAL